MVAQAHGPLAQPLLNTAAVARRSGVPAPTFQSWERRYGFPRPTRNAANGQRLYAETDVAAITWLHAQTRQGRLSISRAIERLRRDPAAPTRAAGSPAQEAGQPSPGLTAEVERLSASLHTALEAYDSERAHALWVEALRVLSPQEVCLRLVGPLQRAVGARWAARQRCVASEHFGSQLLRTRVGALFHTYAARAAASAPLILVACAPGERHELGALVVALFLAEAGYRVQYVGGDLPTLDDLAAAARRLRPSFVVLSATMPASAAALRAPPPDLLAFRVGYGGQAFEAGAAARARLPSGWRYLGADAREALAVVAASVGHVGLTAPAA